MEAGQKPAFLLATIHMQDLRISLCQTSLEWENPRSNYQIFEDLLSVLGPGDTDLILLPEMFTTGFSMSSSKLAEPMDGPSVQWMKAMADRHCSAIAGSLIISESGNYYNRLLWVEPGKGVTAYYDKKHLFGLAGENQYFSQGKVKKFVEYKGWRIGLFICYDLRFPAWTRNHDQLDLMIFLANWPSKRIKAWNTLLPARAIENQCYVAGVNRIGADGNDIPYTGDSAVYAYDGETMLRLNNKNTIETVSLNARDLMVYKRAYPFLADRDTYTFLDNPNPS